MKTQYFKEKLEAEKKELERELGEIGRRNPSNPNDWEATPENIDDERADKIDTADNIEEFESHNAIVVELESRLTNVNAAIGRIEDGTFGICKVGGEKIEEDRLEANPAAETCKAHINN